MQTNTGVKSNTVTWQYLALTMQTNTGVKSDSVTWQYLKSFNSVQTNTGVKSDTVTWQYLKYLTVCKQILVLNQIVLHGNT